MKSTIQLSAAICSILLPTICDDCLSAIDDDDMLLLRITANMLSYSHEQYLQQTVCDLWATITYTRQSLPSGHGTDSN